MCYIGVDVMSFFSVSYLIMFVCKVNFSELEFAHGHNKAPYLTLHLRCVSLILFTMYLNELAVLLDQCAVSTYTEKSLFCSYYCLLLNKMDETAGHSRKVLSKLSSASKHEEN